MEQQIPLLEQGPHLAGCWITSRLANPQ